MLFCGSCLMCGVWLLDVWCCLWCALCCLMFVMRWSVRAVGGLLLGVFWLLRVGRCVLFVVGSASCVVW